jgi:hypothetical protein
MTPQSELPEWIKSVPYDSTYIKNLKEDLSIAWGALGYIQQEDQHCPCGEDPCNRVQEKTDDALRRIAELGEP